MKRNFTCFFWGLANIILFAFTAISQPETVEISIGDSIQIVKMHQPPFAPNNLIISESFTIPDPVNAGVDSVRVNEAGNALLAYIKLRLDSTAIAGETYQKIVTLIYVGPSSTTAAFQHEFLVTAKGDLALPPVPALLSPTDGALDIALSPTFNWMDASDAETYEIEIAKDDAFMNVAASSDNLDKSTFDFTLPDYETTYYWRVRAINSAGISEWSTIWSFTTQVAPPAVPSLTLPADGATDIPLMTNFSWMNAEHATSYQLQISQEEDFSNLIENNSALSSTSFDFTLPGYETTYYWRVRAINTTGNSSWSQVRSFTTDMMTTRLEEKEFVTNLKTYPNPARERIFINFHSAETFYAEIAVFNAVGEMVYSSARNFISGNNALQLNLLGLPGGSYFVKIYGQGHSISRRFLLISK